MVRFEHDDVRVHGPFIQAALNMAETDPALGHSRTSGEWNDVRVLHFADLVNRHDFIDNIVRHSSLSMAVCTMGRPSNIEAPGYDQSVIPYTEIDTPTRRQYPLTILRLAALLRRQRFDVIHAHHYDPCLIATAATLLCPRTALVVGRHYSDAIYLHTTGWRRRVMLQLEGAMNRRAKRIIVPASRIADLMVNRQGVPEDKIAVIPYGFDRVKYDGVDAGARQALRRDLGLQDNLTIGTFGRLYVDKGHRVVLDALPQLRAAIPGLRYLIVGEGAERERLESHVAALNLTDTVSFLGWRHDVTALMSAVDIVVQPSTQEALSQSMVEALLMGRPLVITDVSGANEIVPDDTVGRVIAVGDSKALHDAVVELTDADLRARLGAEGQRHARARFTVAAAVSGHEAVYLKAAASRKAPRHRARRFRYRNQT